MLSLSINTYIHLLFIITIFCCLVLELTLAKEKMNYAALNKLSRIDGIYGLAAIMVVATGLMNWLEFGKGTQYYNSNSFFLVKFSLFILVGLLSIYPTRMIMITIKKYKAVKPEIIELSGYKIIRRVILTELAIMSLIPLLAELMANGIDI